MIATATLGGWTVTATFNLFNLKQKLEMHRGREYSWAEISRLTGLNRRTIDRMAANQTGRVDLTTVTTRVFPVTGNAG